MPTAIEWRSDADLVHWMLLVIQRMGGATLLGPQHENLCRRARRSELMELGGIEWIVEAQGLPNLIHEVVHALFLGYLADDHGFDYGQIPLDIERAEHRAHVWEELTCCALSTSICAPLRDDPERFSRDWFAEQVEIQGVFHGLEDDLPGFCARIDRQLAMPERVAELEATLARGHGLLCAAVGAAGGPSLPTSDLVGLWRDYRKSQFVLA